ncbi:MAG: radical SAM/SPASM domain-containing protein [Deltaproteobacteria bacterium]
MGNPFNDIYRSYEYENARKLPLRAFPFIVDVEPTNHCNLRCKMCPRNMMQRETGFMDFNIFKKVVDECKEYSAAIRLIRYGEHLMHKQLFEFIRTAKEKEIFVHLTTNGLLLDKDKAEELVDLNLDSMIFSFQGATKQGYEDMRYNDKYDLLISNIKQIIDIRNRKNKEKPWVHISSTMTNETKEEIESFKAFWGGITDSVGVGKTTFSQFNKQEYQDTIREYLPKETIERRYSPCSEVYQKLSVNWNGDVTACCGDYDNFLLLGNVKSSSLKEIWNSKKLNEIRNLLDQMRMAELPLCKDCYHTYKEF